MCVQFCCCWVINLTPRWGEVIGIVCVSVNVCVCYPLKRAQCVLNANYGTKKKELDARIKINVTVCINHPFAANIVFTVQGQIHQHVLHA